MRVPWVKFGTLAVLLLFCLPATGALGEGGVDPSLPDNVYDASVARPVVVFPNQTFAEGGIGELSVTLSFPNINEDLDITIYLMIYAWGVYGTEKVLSEISGPLPEFIDYEIGRMHEKQRWMNLTTIPAGKPVTLRPEVDVPEGGERGYYRVRVTLAWSDDPVTTAASMGHFTDEEWKEIMDMIRDGETPAGVDFFVSEGGFTLVPKNFDTVSAPNMVPDFGDFTTPVIRPGESGKYNFTVTNRYDYEITNVTVTVEFYMWATIEDSKPIENIEGPPPKVKGEGGPKYDLVISSIEPGASETVMLTITTSGDTAKGTYFVRHSIEFTYEGDDFVMSSRGFFTAEQWEGFDYTNLYYQLDGSAGIVPDSSFSVKDPVPLWPLATLIVLCVLFGALAVVFYLAEEHGEQYPRLKKGLQFWTGRWEQRKRLLQQRMDELRGEDWEKDEDEEREGDKSGSSEEAPEEGAG
jgi:hypothetical protein